MIENGREALLPALFATLRAVAARVGRESAGF
jgi:hypothetical protein